MNTFEILKQGEVKLGERTFTRLVGGFGEDKEVVTTKQIAELMGLDNKVVVQTINRNIDKFESDNDIIDLKNSVTESDPLLSYLKDIGYNKQSYANSKNIYILSESGFLLYLKFAEGDKAVELYKEFLELYFKVKAENQVMKLSIEEEIQQLEEDKIWLFGKMVMAKNEVERADYSMQLENKNKRITELEKVKSEKETIEKLQDKIHLGNVIEESNHNYDIGVVAKVLGVDGFGRNKVFKLLRDQKILMDGNVPYQSYMKYFSVIPVVTDRFSSTKTLLKPEGVGFLIKRLIASGVVVTKTVDEVLNELNGQDRKAS